MAPVFDGSRRYRLHRSDVNQPHIHWLLMGRRVSTTQRRQPSLLPPVLPPVLARLASTLPPAVLAPLPPALGEVLPSHRTALAEVLRTRRSLHCQRRSRKRRRRSRVGAQRWWREEEREEDAYAVDDRLLMHTQPQCLQQQLDRLNCRRGA